MQAKKLKKSEYGKAAYEKRKANESSIQKRARLDHDNSLKQSRVEKTSDDTKFAIAIEKKRKLVIKTAQKTPEDVYNDKQKRKESYHNNKVKNGLFSSSNIQSNFAPKPRFNQSSMITNSIKLDELKLLITTANNTDIQPFPPNLVDPYILYEKTRLHIESISCSDTSVCVCCSLRLPSISHPHISMQTITFDDIPNLHILKSKLKSASNITHEYGLNEIFNDYTINPNGIDATNHDNVSICDLCNTALSNNIMPKYAIANDLYFGSTQKVLPELTYLERKCISLVRFSSVIVKLTVYESNSQLGFKGHLIMRAQDPKPLDVQIMPLSCEAISDFIHVILIKPRLSIHDNLAKLLGNVLKCRRNVMREWLMYLKQNHFAYKEIQISEDALMTYDLDGVPQAIIDDSITQLPPDNEDFATEQGVNVDVNDYSKPIESMEFLQKSFVTDETGATLPSTNIYEYCDTTFETQEPLFAMMSGSDELNGQSDHFLSKAFPHLYPNGLGSRHSKRNSSISIEEEICHLLCIDDPRFRNDFQFQCLFYEIITKKQIFQSIHYTVKTMNDANLNAIHKYTRPEIIAALNNTNKKDETQQTKIIMAQCKLASKMAIWSQQYKSRRRLELLATIVRFGSPTLFVTVSPNDVINPLAYKFCIKHPSFFNFDDLIDKDIRTELASSNPVGLSLFFASLTTSIIDNLFGAKSLYNDGLFGKHKCHYGMVETQNRGTLHIHILLWIDGKNKS